MLLAFHGFTIIFIFLLGAAIMARREHTLRNYRRCRGVVLSNLVYRHQATLLTDCFSTNSPLMSFSLLTTRVNSLKPLMRFHRFSAD